MTRPLLAAVLLAAAGCAERAPAPPAVPPPDTLAGVEILPPGERPVVAGPGEVIRLDTAVVVVVVVERGGEVYEVDVTDGAVTAGGAETPADRAALRAWLARFAPLAADGRYDGAAPQAVQDAAAHRLAFAFADGSERTVAFEPRGDGVAVVSQDDGPVWRLDAARLDALLPPPAALR